MPFIPKQLVISHWSIRTLLLEFFVIFSQKGYKNILGAILVNFKIQNVLKEEEHFSPF